MTLTVWNQLTKPRVSLLVLSTVMPGLYLGSSKSPSWLLIVCTLMGTYLMVSASFILNQYVERNSDSLMYRTKQRPFPAGKISSNNALRLGIVVSAAAFFILYFFVNLLTAICALASLIIYVFIYTILLKPRTDQNIVIGGISGCVGPLIGYAAISNSLPFPAWILFLMIFLWTPAHFWSLAIYLKEDYERASIPMLPVIKGVKTTSKSIFIYSMLYSISCFTFYFVYEDMGNFFLTIIIVLTCIMITLSIYLMRHPLPGIAKKFFFFSILHLFLINVAIILDAKIFV